MKQIKPLNKGIMETYLLLFIFAFLMWGFGLVANTLIQHHDIQKTTWVYGVSRQNEVESKKITPWVRQHLNAKDYLQINLSEKNACQFLPSAAFKNKLPLVFYYELFKNCPQKVNVTNTTLYEHDFDKGLEGGPKPRPHFIQSSRSFLFPQSRFKNSGELKTLLLEEAALKAGFGLIPYNLLGAREIAHMVTGL